MKECVYFRPGRGLRRYRNAADLPLHYCAKQDAVCISEAHPYGGSYKVCQGCELRSEKEQTICANRRHWIRQERGTLCGRKNDLFEIYSCDVHIECTSGKFCQNQKEKSCLGCEDFVELTGRTFQRHFYRSIADQWRDAYAWSQQLPENIVGFCGVHRSGIGVAQALACARNCHYVDWEALVGGASPWKTKIRRWFGADLSREGFVLVVDDTAWSGSTMQQEIKPALARRRDVPIRYGALYYGPKGRSQIDYGFGPLAHTRQTFQTNLFHDVWTPSMCFDLDGVFCEDCPSIEVDHDEQRYIEWMRNAKPLVVPTRQVGQIVTARLEKYRSETEAWLHRNKIQFKTLVMFQGVSSNEERNAMMDAVVKHKANAYRRASGSTLFVESDDWQAERIANETGRSTLAWPSQRHWNCD